MFPTRICYSVLLFLFAYGCSQGQQTENDITGFRGLTWGAPRPEKGMARLDSSSIGGRKYSAANWDYEVYSRDNDTLDLGGAELTNIEYAYWHDKLLGISLSCSGRTNFDTIKRKAIDRFGEATISGDASVEIYTWDSPSGTARLEFYSSTAFGDLSLVSKKVQKEKGEYNREEGRRQDKAKGFGGF